MERPLAADMIESCICSVGINAFVGFVNDQNIPCNAVFCAEFGKLLDVAAKINGPLQVLQGNKFNTARTGTLLRNG